MDETPEMVADRFRKGGAIRGFGLRSPKRPQ
jgi:hypothetical protein